MPDLQVEKSFVGPRTFLTVREFIWYNCSAVCGSSVWWLYGGVNGALLQEGLCHRLCVPSLLQPESLPLQQATADPCLCRRHSNTQRQVWLSLCGVSGSWCTQVFFEASEQGLRQKVSAILDTFDSNQFMLYPWTMLFFQKLCPGPFPSVTE